MLMQSCLRSWTLATITAVGMACGAPAAHADALSALLNQKVAPAATPRQTLPALKAPRVFRESEATVCSRNDPVMGPNTCRMTFDPVPAHHVLQIDKLNCIGGINGNFFIFNGQIKVERIAGLVLTPITGIAAGAASGPFYFKGNERPILAITANSPTDTADCVMYGTLWQTN